jgi:hypothetical protein
VVMLIVSTISILVLCSASTLFALWTQSHIGVTGVL